MCIYHTHILIGFIYPVVSHWAWSPEGWLSNGITWAEEEGLNKTIVSVTYQVS